MPPLQKQAVTVPVLGLDSHSDPKTAVPGTLTVADNVFLKRTAQGQGELRKRFGYTLRSQSVVTGGTVGFGRKLASFNDEQLVINQNGIFSWDPQSVKWVSRASSTPQCSLTPVPLGEIRIDTSSGDQRVDMAVGGGYLCAVACQGATSPARVVVTNLSTGVHVLDTDLSFSVNGPKEIKVVALSTVFMIFCSFNTGSNLTTKTIAYATPTSISAEVNVSTTLDTAGNGDFWDVVRAGTNDWAMVALRTTAPNTTVVRWNSNQSSGGSATSADTANNGMGWLDWDASDASMYLSYVSSVNGLKTHTVTAATAAISATTVNDAAVLTSWGITGYRNVTVNNIFVGQMASARDAFVQRSTGGAVAVYQRGMCMSTRAFRQGSKFYLGLCYGDQGSVPTNGVILDQRSVFVLDVTTTTAFTGVVVAKAFFGEGGGALGLSKACMSVPTVDANRVAVPALRQYGQLDLANGFVPPVSAYALLLDFTLPGVSPCVQAGERLYLPGGSVKEYDGLNCAEAGFHTIPFFPTLTAGAGAAALTVSSTYGVIIVWLYADNRGQTHRSAPSQAQFVTLGPAQTSFTVACQPCRLTERSSSIYIDVYITDPNGSVFHFVGRVKNDQSVDSVTFTPTANVTTAFLAQQPQLYTTDGTLAHEPFPPAKQITGWRGRLFLAGTDDPTDLWVSDERISGEGTSISSANIVPMERDGGPITAMSEMDDRLVIMKRDSIYELVGDGPAPSGDGGFGQPARITAVTGTVTPESMVKTPQGLMFQSLRGFYLLPIGGGLPTRLRAPEAIETVVVVGSACLENVEQVRFMSTGGQTLVYHFGFPDEQGLGRWTTHSSQFAVDCAVFSGKFCYLTSSGFVLDENTGWDDNGAAIAVQVRFAWLNLAGLFGRHRLYKVAAVTDWLASTTVTMTQAVNFDPSVVQTATLAATAASFVPAALPNAFGDAVAHQITLSESSTTQGFRLSALVLEIAGKGGTGKLKVGQAFT